MSEFVALHYERHPESVRTVPWLRPAGRDSGSGASGASGDEFEIDGYNLGVCVDAPPFSL